MQIQASRRLQYPMQFNQPSGHHYQIGHHLIRADELPHRAYHAAYIG